MRAIFQMLCYLQAAKCHQPQVAVLFEQFHLFAKIKL